MATDKMYNKSTYGCMMTKNNQKVLIFNVWQKRGLRAHTAISFISGEKTNDITSYSRFYIFGTPWKRQIFNLIISRHAKIMATHEIRCLRPEFSKLPHNNSTKMTFLSMCVFQKKAFFVDKLFMSNERSRDVCLSLTLSCGKLIPQRDIVLV
jgi:hypothetical protein